MPVIRKRTMPYLSAAFKGKEIPRNPALSAMSEVDKSLLRELMEDNMDLTLIKKEIEELADAHEFLPLTCAEHLLHFLHSLPLELFMIVLIVVDVCLVLSSMIIEVYVDEGKLEESQAVSNEYLQYLNLLSTSNSCQAIQSTVAASLGDPNAAQLAISRVLESYSEANSSIHARRKRSTGIGESSPTISVSQSVIVTLEDVVHVTHYLSIAILSVLVLEALLKVIAHGKHILSFKMEIFDALVNIASLIIDILLTDATLVGAIGKVLVILTLIWRVVRILNAIIMTSRARYKFRIRLLKTTKQILEEKVDYLEKNTTRAKSEIDRLSQVATFYGAPPYEVKVFSDFVEEERTAKFGIQASLMQLLRVNNAIAGHPLSRRQKAAVETRAVFQLRTHASLPDLSPRQQQRGVEAMAADSLNFGGSATESGAYRWRRGDRPQRPASAEPSREESKPSHRCNGTDDGYRKAGESGSRNARACDAGCVPMRRSKSWPGGAYNRARRMALGPHLVRGPIGSTGGDMYFEVNESRNSAEGLDRLDAAKPRRQRTTSESEGTGAAAESVVVELSSDERTCRRSGAAESGAVGCGAVDAERRSPDEDAADVAAASESAAVAAAAPAGPSGGLQVSAGKAAAADSAAAGADELAPPPPRRASAGAICVHGASPGQERAEQPISKGSERAQRRAGASANGGADAVAPPCAGPGAKASDCQTNPGLILCASALTPNGHAHPNGVEQADTRL